jgi:hypothetical protein
VKAAARWREDGGHRRGVADVDRNRLLGPPPKLALGLLSVTSSAAARE